MCLCVGEDVRGICKQLPRATGTNKRSSTSASICRPRINLPGLCLFAYSHHPWTPDTARVGQQRRGWQNVCDSWGISSRPQLGVRLCASVHVFSLSEFVFFCLLEKTIHTIITRRCTCSRCYSNQNRNSPTVPPESCSSLEQWRRPRRAPTCFPRINQPAALLLASCGEQCHRIQLDKNTGWGSASRCKNEDFQGEELNCSCK